MTRGRRERRRPRRGWTREAVRDALRSWAREEGRAPRAYEWAPWGAVALGIRSAQTLKWERERDRWPSLDVAVARWGVVASRVGECWVADASAAGAGAAGAGRDGAAVAGRGQRR